MTSNICARCWDSVHTVFKIASCPHVKTSDFQVGPTVENFTGYLDYNNFLNAMLKTGSRSAI